MDALPEFELLCPKSVDEALAARDDDAIEAWLCASSVLIPLSTELDSLPPVVVLWWTVRAAAGVAVGADLLRSR